MRTSGLGRKPIQPARARSLLGSTRAVVLVVVTGTCVLTFAPGPSAATPTRKGVNDVALGRSPANVPELRPACSGPPAAPVASITNVSRSGADLTWTTAEGATAYSYNLNFDGGAWTGWTRVESPITVRVQRPGATRFVFAVLARNSCGVSYDPAGCNPEGVPGRCTYNDSVFLRGRPSPPSAASALYASGVLTVSWNAPADDGGSPITGYQVTASPGGSVCNTTSTWPSCSASPSVPPGTVVTFTVVATNAAGSSDPSAPSNPITVLGAPSPPTDVKVASTTINSATVAWNSSQSGGGTTVSRYVATARPGGKTCQSAGLSCRISGLKPGATYRFEVVADNGTLTSEPASSEKVRLPRPAAPRPVPKPKPSQSLS